MTEAVTLNQARLHLGVGKEKLKRLLTETGIVPIQINRQRKEIGLEQLEQLQQLLNNDPATSGLDSGQPVKTTGRPDKPTSQDYRSTGQPSPIDFEATIELALTKERLETAQKEISQLVNQQMMIRRTTSLTECQSTIRSQVRNQNIRWFLAISKADANTPFICDQRHL